VERVVQVPLGVSVMAKFVAANLKPFSRRFLDGLAKLLQVRTSTSREVRTQATTRAYDKHNKDGGGFGQVQVMPIDLQLKLKCLTSRNETFK
jgi:hypothetical protein